MARIGLYFYLNFAKRLQAFNVLDLGTDRPYTDDIKLREEVSLFSERHMKVFSAEVQRLGASSNHPIGGMILSGVAMEMLRELPKDTASLHQLLLSNQLQLISQPYYRSLSFLLSRDQLEREVQLMSKQGQRWLQLSEAFANTALIYNDFLAFWADQAGFRLLIAPTSAAQAAGKGLHQLYHPPHLPEMRVLIEDQPLAQFCYTEAQSATDIRQRISDSLQPDAVLGLGIDLLQICPSGRLSMLMDALFQIQQNGIATIHSPTQLLSEPASGGQLSVLETQTAFGKHPDELWFDHPFQQEAWLSLNAQPKLGEAFPYLQEERYLRALAPQQPGDQQHIRAYRHLRAILADINLKNSEKTS